MSTYCFGCRRPAGSSGGISSMRSNSFFSVAPSHRCANDSARERGRALAALEVVAMALGADAL